MSIKNVFVNLVKKGFNPSEMSAVGGFKGLMWEKGCIWFDESGKISNSLIKDGKKEISTVFEHSGNVTKVNKSVTLPNKTKLSSNVTTKTADGYERVITDANGKKTEVIVSDAGRQVALKRPNNHEYEISFVEKGEKKGKEVLQEPVLETADDLIAEKVEVLGYDPALDAANLALLDEALLTPLPEEGVAGFMDDVIGIVDDIFPFGF